MPPFGKEKENDGCQNVFSKYYYEFSVTFVNPKLYLTKYLFSSNWFGLMRNLSLKTLQA